MGPPSYMRSVVDRSVVMRLMTVHNHITKTMIFQYNSFILQVVIDNTVTVQNKDTTTQSINLVNIAKDNAIYTTYTTQSGPVYLSCPTECRRLLLLLTDQQQVRKSKGFSRVTY